MSKDTRGMVWTVWTKIKGQIFFEYIWLCMTLRPEGSRTLFQVSSKSTHDWLMDGRVSDVDDISYFSWKCRRSSAQDYALNTHTNCFVGCSPHVCLKKYKDSWDIIFFMTVYCVVLAIMDMASAKSDVNGAKKIVCFWRFWIKKWQKPKNYVSKTYRPNLYCLRLEVLYF